MLRTDINLLNSMGWAELERIIFKIRSKNDEKKDDLFWVDVGLN